MSNDAGMVRSNKRLDRSGRHVEKIGREIDESYRNFIITWDLMEWKNVATVARWFIHGARMRQESRAVP